MGQISIESSTGLSFVISDTALEWRKVTLDETQLCWHEFPRKGTSRFILKKNLRGGAHGRVWLAVSEKSYKVCVIKIPKGSSSLVAEHTNWMHYVQHCANFIEKPRIQLLNNRMCLVMPYFTPIESPPSEETKHRTYEAVCELAEAGMYHQDLEWRHVGMWNDKVVFFDLSLFKCHIDHRAEKEAAKKNMLSRLGLRS